MRPDSVFSFAGVRGVELTLSASRSAESGKDATAAESCGTLDPRRGSTGIKAITEIEFQCEGEPATSFSVRLTNSCLETRAMIDGATQAGRVVGCDDKPDGELVAEELDILGHDTVYEDAIQMAAGLAHLL